MSETGFAGINSSWHVENHGATLRRNCSGHEKKYVGTAIGEKQLRTCEEQWQETVEDKKYC